MMFGYADGANVCAARGREHFTPIPSLTNALCGHVLLGWKIDVFDTFIGIIICLGEHPKNYKNGLGK